MRTHTPTILSLAACWLTLFAPLASAAEWEFHLSFDDHVRKQPFTGRVYVFLSRNKAEPRTGPGWFSPDPFLAKDVENWAPGQVLTLSNDRPDEFFAFPESVPGKDLNGYSAQAVARFNPLEPTVGTGSGNGFSQAVDVDSSATEEGGITLLIDGLIPPKPFHETERHKLFEVRSRLLSEYHGHDVFLRAAVILPKSYDTQSQRRYPTIFEIPGFGGTHHDSVWEHDTTNPNPSDVEFLHVVLDPSCPLGHHVFADSENNGPYGTAFVDEFLPAFDASYRSVSEPRARFLTGHSSGGWSSLWLQITFPEMFGGTWSTAPDPVDFRDFQRINLYGSDANMYVDAEGKPRPLARKRGHVAIWYRDFAGMEQVLGLGGQLHSFEAVFSPRGPLGKPVPLWDWESGAVDASVAKAWEKYDIRLVLERRWEELGPNLQGKIHVHTGELDTFYLEGAVRLLKQSLQALGSDAVVEIHPGKNHGTLLSKKLRTRIREEMVQTFLQTEHANAPLHGQHELNPMHSNGLADAPIGHDHQLPNSSP